MYVGHIQVTYRHIQTDLCALFKLRNTVKHSSDKVLNVLYYILIGRFTDACYNQDTSVWRGFSLVLSKGPATYIISGSGFS